MSQETKDDRAECVQCGYIADYGEFNNLECDGDVTGTCPKCHAHTIIVPACDDIDPDEKIL